MAKKVKCEFCGKDYSESYIGVHLEKCKQNPNNIQTSKEEIKDVVEKIMENKKTESPKIKRQRDLSEMICVVNITNSKLIYISKSVPGYRIDWDGYLDENWIEYKELINMRNSQRSFFQEPWVMCDWEVLKDLKVDNYYKNIIDLENLDLLFQKSPEQLEETLKVIPDGIKKLVIDRAFELRREKKLDSLSIIEVIEKKLKVDLSL